MNLGFAPATGSPVGQLNAKDYTFLKFVLFHGLLGFVLYFITAVYGHFNFGVYAPLASLAYSLITGVLTQLLNGK